MEFIMPTMLVHFDASALDAHIANGELILSLPVLDVPMLSEEVVIEARAAGLDPFVIDAAADAAAEVFTQHLLAATLLKARCR